MTADVTERSAPGAGWAGSLPAAAGQLLRRVGDGDHAPNFVAVLGPGGTGKSMLLDELAAAWRSAGVPVTCPQDAPPADELTGELAVVVDDGQRLTPDESARVRELAGHPGVRVAVAYRPWPRTAALTALVDQLGADRSLVVLDHLGRAAVQRWADAELGAAATPELVDLVLHQTGGLPRLVGALLHALAREPTGVQRGRRSARAVPAEVADRVRADLAELPDDDRAVLHALAAGSPLDVELLAAVLRLPEARTAELVARARAGGLLLSDGTVVPLVADVLLGTTPADLTRSTRRRLFGLLLDRGDDALPVARALAADRVRDPRVAALLTDQGTAALAGDPGLAGQLLAEAVASGASPAGLAARRATAAAVAGDLDAALQWADQALQDEAAPDAGRAAGAAAAVLARRGMLARSAELYRTAGPDRAGAAALALLALGRLEEATEALSAVRPAATRTPTLGAGVEQLMAEGVLRSVRPGASPTDVAAALSSLTQAAAMLEPIGRTALLLDTPASLAALLAVHSGELAVAESVLERAIAADVGGAPCRPRHLLLLAWTAMLRGATGTAHELVEQARSAAGGPLEPRDELYLRALEVGLARRASDAPALATAWERARQMVLRHPIDLFTLLPLGELVVGAARLADGQRLAPHRAEAADLLAGLGEPAVWATPLHWSGAQAAILADDPAALEPHASALVAAARTSPYAATVAAAGRCWLRLLSGEVDAAAVVTAATGLAAVGLPWDGSRLAGQAAVRSVDSRDRVELLHCARTLAAGEEPVALPAPTAPAVALPTARTAPGGALLSQRERDVAELVVAGHTYREIGGRLYISAKTVEHHVSRMRQRLGASTRSDLLARLRAELADT